MHGQFLSDTFFKSFSSTVNMFISIFMIQILHNITNSWIFNDIGRNCLLGNRKKIAKFLFLMRTFTCRSTFPYALCTLSHNSLFASIIYISQKSPSSLHALQSIPRKVIFSHRFLTYPVLHCYKKKLNLKTFIPKIPIARLRFSIPCS